MGFGVMMGVFGVASVDYRGVGVGWRANDIDLRCWVAGDIYQCVHVNLGWDRLGRCRCRCSRSRHCSVIGQCRGSWNKVGDGDEIGSTKALSYALSGE